MTGAINPIELDGDSIDAVSYVREASRSIHQGLDMLFCVPSHKGDAARKELDLAEALMQRASVHLQKAIANIRKSPSNATAQPVAEGETQ